MTYQVYSLSDPITGEIRYVGQTARTLRIRLTEHIQDTKRRALHSSKWVKSLLKRGAEPLIELVEVHDTPEAVDEAEQFFIDYFRSLGFNLTNLTGGGKVTRDVIVTDKMREMARVKNLGKTLSANTRAKISASKVGIKLPPRSAEYRAKISATNKGRVRTAEVRLKYSQMRGGKPVVHVATGLRFDTATLAANYFGLWPQGVSQTCNGRIKHTGGHVFKFVEDVK